MAADDDGVGVRCAESVIRCADMVSLVAVFYVINQHVLFPSWHGPVEIHSEWFHFSLDF